MSRLDRWIERQEARSFDGLSTLIVGFLCFCGGLLCGTVLTALVGAL